MSIQFDSLISLLIALKLFHMLLITHDFAYGSLYSTCGSTTTIPPTGLVQDSWKVHSHKVDSRIFQMAPGQNVKPLACCLVIVIPQLIKYRTTTSVNRTKWMQISTGTTI